MQLRLVHVGFFGERVRRSWRKHEPGTSLASLSQLWGVDVQSMVEAVNGEASFPEKHEGHVNV